MPMTTDIQILEWAVTRRRGEPDEVTDIVFKTLKEAQKYVSEDDPRDARRHPLRILARTKAVPAGSWMEWYSRDMK